MRRFLWIGVNSGDRRLLDKIVPKGSGFCFKFGSGYKIDTDMVSPIISRIVSVPCISHVESPIISVSCIIPGSSRCHIVSHIDFHI